MQTVSLYQSKETWIHRTVDPLTKLVYLLSSIVCAFVVPTQLGASVMALVHLFLLTWARELRRAVTTLLASLFLVATIFVIQGLYNPQNHTILWTIGPIHVYREGMLFALTITLRIVNVIAASSLFVLTTSPSGVMDACVRRGLSPKLGYIVTSILQIIPAMMNSAATIRQAQQARGMPVEGNLFVRIKAFLPLFGPIVMSSLMSIQDRAMALEVRGFSVKARRTFFHEEQVNPWMAPLRLLLLAITLGFIVWRIVA